MFLGSGVSRRYFDAPDWRGLLESVATTCPLIEFDFAYYEQSLGTLPWIGEEFAKRFKDWAWKKGKTKFPPDYYTSEFGQDIFLKHSVSEYLKDITPKTAATKGSSQRAKELKRLQGIRPHAIVTTNYDTFIERLFPEYQPVIGQQILTSDSAFFGEIFKIHGCVTSPQTLVLTESDYEEFQSKKKYLSAKLLTFFLEHPVLLVGYSARDPNIQSLLSDIDLILATEGALIPNIFLLRRSRPQDPKSHPSREELVPVGENRHVRIRSITTDDFSWVFDGFTSSDAIDRIRPKLLRGLLARAYDLVRHDIPKRTVEVDYGVLERVVDQQDELAKILGITIVGDATHVNAGYPYTLTGVARELGYETWHRANRLIGILKEQTGYDIKSFDNKYHVAFKIGEKTDYHKYSPHAVDVLKKIRDDSDEEVDLELDQVDTQKTKGAASAS